MKKTIKKLWIKALRSGKYKQASGHLRKNGGFCCLGVLCDLYKQTTGNGKWLPRDSVCRTSAFQIGSFTSHAALPEDVMDWAELSSPDPQCGNLRLSVHNDGNRNEWTNRVVAGSRKNFKQIANLIQKYL